MSSEISAKSPFKKILNSKFKFVIDYFKTKDLPNGKCICSPPFTADGYDWCLEYYPQGYMPEFSESHASLFLFLKSKAKYITAEYSFQLLDKSGNFITIGTKNKVSTFAYGDMHWGYDRLISRDEIEHLYCEDGILVISCNIRVLTEQKIVEKYFGSLCEDIEKLWKDKKIFDVTFEVEGESIPAHKFMLAARSRVFEAELFGSMAEAKMEHVKIDEMKAEVFKALLHFVYTDKLPIDESTDDGTHSVELLQGLFVAADRYDLCKLSQMCAEQLEKNLSVDRVTTTLILADRHSRAGTELKKKCLKFASNLDNFSLISLTDGYFQLFVEGPSTLLDELRKMVKEALRIKGCWEKYILAVTKDLS